MDPLLGLAIAVGSVVILVGALIYMVRDVKR
jgi:hypothetical protein